MLLRALASGTAASLLSTLVSSCYGQRRTDSYASSSNDTSHWLWGERAHGQDGADLRHTATGYAIHHASSVWWAAWYEAWLARSGSRPVAKAAAMAAIAYAVDYHVVPRRLTPGFERHVTARGMLATYAAFGVGLAGVALARRLSRAHR